MPVKPIPDGYHTVTPYIIVQGVERLLTFLQRAFDAKEIERVTAEDGSIRHAETRIGNSVVMFKEAGGEWKAMPSAFYLYVADVDATYRRALEAGATSTMVPADMFYGDRSGGVRDAHGNIWWIASRKEELSMDEIKRRAAEHEKTLKKK